MAFLGPAADETAETETAQTQTAQTESDETEGGDDSPVEAAEDDSDTPKE